MQNAQVYYIHADHLGTPRVITEPATSTVVWRWDSDPFGTTPANDDPDGDGTHFTYNLRFPGQYYDAETGLHYNYYRDYDPGTGRYIESDPIGLGGGLNTYGYLSGNPLSRIDPLGLIGPQESSIQNEIEVAIAQGDYNKLKTLLEAANPEEAQLIRGALSNRLRSTLSKDAIKEIVRNSEAIAKGQRIRKVEDLCRKFGGKARDWVKKKGWDSKGNE